MIRSSQRLLPDNTQHSQETDIHAPVGFEPTISAGERPQTYALDRAATGTGTPISTFTYYFITYSTTQSVTEHRKGPNDGTNSERTCNTLGDRGFAQVVKLSWYFPGGPDVTHRDLTEERCISFGYSFRAPYRCVCTTGSNNISKCANNFLCYPQSQHVAALKSVSMRFLQTQFFCT